MPRVRLLLLAFACTALPVAADDGAVLHGDVGRIRVGAWVVDGFESTFELTAGGLAGDVRLGRIADTESDRVVEDVRVACADIELTTRGLNCARALFDAEFLAVGRQTVRGAFAWDRVSGTVQVGIADLVVADGRLQLDIAAGDFGTDVKFTGKQVRLDGLLRLAANFTEALSGYSGDGLADVAGSLAAPASGAMRIVLSADLDAVSIANDTGAIAADGVAGKLDLDVSLAADSTRFTLGFESGQGEAYVEPVYASFSEFGFRLDARDVTTTDFARFEVPQFRLMQDTLLDVDGSATLAFPATAEEPVGIDADVSLHDTSVETLYTSLVQVGLAGTVLGSLDTDGRIDGRVQIADGALTSAVVRLDDVILDDQRGRFAVYGLAGDVDWRTEAAETAAPSLLRWDSGTVYSIIVGGGETRLQLGDNDVELLAPLRLPTMGGALRINQLALQDFGSSEATARLDAELEPIKLGQLTGAFGWPAFSGTLSGRLPLLQLAENTITVGGTLSARAFDGTIEMANLRIEQPFGRVPRLHGDLAFRGLDLERVTDAFSFGRIQGRLSADVKGLQMQSWRPVAMDLHVYTPPGDRSQHRISQRAVENLASVGGGGAGAALSSGFLQFFEVFAYDRIGMRCILRDGACAMSGVAPAGAGPQGRGYYIVKGSGVPRIDVVGYRESVSWARLVGQLTAITRSGSPTVE